MKRSLKGKLILSYLAVALITVLVVSVLVYMTSGQSLMNLVVEEQVASMTEAVKTYYTQYGTTVGFFDYYSKTNNQPAPEKIPIDGPVTGPDVGKQHDFRGVVGLVDSEYKALIPTFGIGIGEVVPTEKIKDPTPIVVDGVTIAYVLPDTSHQFNLSAEEEVFLQRTTLAIGLAAAAGVIAAVGMGFFLASGLLKPIKRLTTTSQALAHGDLQQQVPVTSKDELGQLTATFNQMSADLSQADAQRKRMTADITHDLSTPLQIISGYMEMLEAGEVNLTPQRIEIIKTEIEHLRRLVGDMTTLTQVEAGALDIQLQPVNPNVLMDRIYQAYLPIMAQHGIELKFEAGDNPQSILVDEGRMLQVLKNLVENALRYTPKRGTITLRVVSDQQVRLSVTDSGTGIDAEDLPYVFDRFYRADKARGTNSGKMGLGLAICKALVSAQGGEIAAQSQGKNLGTTMLITFNPASIE